MSPDPRVDAYIASAAPFARPILLRLREGVRQACPDVEESIRWGHPAFLLDGRILCIASAFKAHCGFVYWDPAMKLHLRSVGRLKPGAMGHYGRILETGDLPEDSLLREDIRKAVDLHRSGGNPARTKGNRPPETKKAPGRRPKTSKGGRSEGRAG